jgi:hypothetical protein
MIIMSDDNIIPFPNFSRKDRLEQGDEEILQSDSIEMWRKGLQGTFEQQWRTYERMFGFIDSQVQEVIAEFLSTANGDPTLKTRFLQKLKLICSSQLDFSVSKRGMVRKVTLSDVPIDIEDWADDILKPAQQLENEAFNEPSLIEMGKELWIYLLEKEYPFVPQITDSLCWTGILHYYTLRMINEEDAQLRLGQLAKQYKLSATELIQQTEEFERLLWHA